MKGIFSFDSPLMTALTSIGDCVCLSFLWIVFSLPLVTAGAASAAAYDAALHVIRRGETGLFKRFWKAFRDNFKRSTLLWLVALALLAFLTVDIMGLRNLQVTGKMRALYYIVLVVWCLVFTWSIYLAAYCARFNGSFKEVLRLTLTLMGIHPVRTVTVAAIALGGVALALVAPFMLILIPAAVFMFASWPIEKVFRAHMSPEDLERDLKEDPRTSKNEAEEEDNDDQ